ncbi:MAG: hypothetical protein PHU25_01750 [Deltaproteobacteria bacterium]|nr:hypothetical protein [Deltaproteobacteria bacterium]
MLIENDPFLQEGISRYADAKATLRHFEQEMTDRLIEVIQKKNDWTTYRKERGKQAVVSGSLRKRTESAKPRITVHVSGHVVVNNKKTKAKIVVALQWEPNFADKPFIVFARFFKCPDYLQRFDAPQESSRGVRSYKANEKKTHLYVVPDENMDLRKVVNLLLDELQLYVQ